MLCHSFRSGSLAAIACVLMLAMPAEAASPAPPAVASAADSDPAKLGWMQGAPPAPDRMVRFADGTYFTFPQLRWSFAHFRELVPTARISRGPGPVAELPEAPRADLAGVTFVPTGGSQPVNWVSAFDAIYGDGVLVRPDVGLQESLPSGWMADGIQRLAAAGS